ncbi:MAG TPA: asparagine synthase C-terminal domain-containing protein, partial [Albitalea sp.]|nr:asparagine synthase C-terminal domain-containing protein [Albitalea sp.]
DLFREDKVRRFWARRPDSAWRPALLSRLNRFVDRDPKADAFWRMFFGVGLQNTADPFYSHRRRWDNTSQMKRVFAPEFRAQMLGDDDLLADLESYLDPGRARWHPLCRAQYLEMTLFMSGYLLSSQGDRMMMGHSVEGRVPFLDHRLIELAARIPPKFKLRGLQEKFILKHAFADILPAIITERPKQPYRAPIGAAFAGADNLASRLLGRDALERTGFANAGAVEKLLSKAGPDGTGLGERDEMALSTVASLQLLNHLFVDNFKIASRETPHEERTAVAQ